MTGTATQPEAPVGDGSRGEARAGTARSGLLRRAGPDILAITAFVALAAWVTSGYWVDVQHRLSSHLPTDHTWFEWLLAHGAYSVRHLSNPLFSYRQNAPVGVNMMANTSMLGISLPLAPLTMWLGPQVTYVISLVGGLAATASTTYWALHRHLAASRGAAFVGGLFAGFAPGVIHHANGQPNFVTNFLLPPIVVLVFRLGASGRWLRDGVVLAALVTYQVFLNEELLLLTALACAVAVAVVAVQRRSLARVRARAFLLGLAVTAVASLAVLAYPLWFQFRGPQSYRGLQAGVFHSWGEDFAAYVTYARDTIAGTPAVEKTIGLTEQNSWFGWPLVVLVVLVIALCWRTSVVVRTAAVVIAVFAFGAIGPRVRVDGRLTGIFGPWAYLPDRLPLLEMLMPSRLVLVVVGAVAVLLAVAWDAPARRPAGARLPDRVARLSTYAAVAVALVPLLPRALPTMPVGAPPQFIMSGAWRTFVPPGTTLVPVPVPSNTLGLATLRWSVLTEQEFPIPGGYFIGPDQQGAGTFGAPARPTERLINRTVVSGRLPRVTDADRERALADLRYWKASAVVLGPQEQESVLLRLMTALLGPPQRVDDVWLWDVRVR